MTVSRTRTLLDVFVTLGLPMLFTLVALSLVGVAVVTPDPEGTVWFAMSAPVFLLAGLGAYTFAWKVGWI